MTQHFGGGATLKSLTAMLVTGFVNVVVFKRLNASTRDGRN